MTVPWDRASTTMLDELEGAMQVPDVPQSCEGGQPPQVPPQASSPQVLPAQLDLQPGAGPPSAVLPDDEPPDAPSGDPVPPLDEPVLPEEPPDDPPAPSSPPAAASDPPDEPPSPAAAC